MTLLNRRRLLQSGLAAAAAAPVLMLPRRARSSAGPDVTIQIFEETGHVHLSGDPLSLGGEGFGTEPVEVRATGGRVIAGGKKLSGTVSAGPGVEWKGKRYGGNLVLKAEGQKLRLLETLPLESYLPGVVLAETYESWEPAAHEAQAVSARSYALLRLQRGRAKGADYDFVADIRDKAYSGLCDNGQILEAVRVTAGERLMSGGKVVEAVFHSCCGGMTEAAEAVWGNDVSYLKGVVCEFCRDSPEYVWNCRMEPGDMLGKLAVLGVTGSSVVSLRVSKKTASKRAREFEIGTDTGVQVVDGAKFRTAVGGTLVRSLRCRADVIDGMADFIGSGYGHGVGMCQWGAQGMALEDRDRRAILMHYYPGTRIERD